MRPYNEIALTFNHFGELQVYQITVTMSHNYAIIMSHKMSHVTITSLISTSNSLLIEQHLNFFSTIYLFFYF